MRKKFGNLILVLIMLIGVGLLVYPTFSDWWNSFHQTRAIAGYTAAVEHGQRGIRPHVGGSRGVQHVSQPEVRTV